MTKRLNLIFLLKVCALFITVVVLGLILLSLWVIGTAPLEKLERVVSTSKSKSIKAEIVLESGSVVSKETLKNYLLFSKGFLKPSFLQTQEKLVELEENFELPSLISNDCEVIYCYQHRLAFEDIPGVFWKGLIGIEDLRFLNHSGVDLRALARALVHDIISLSFEQGGSTLTQQLVKNLFYSNERKISRKIKEMVISIYIENKYEKENILEAYLNEVVWGSFQGIRIKGVFAAAVFYFGKRPSEINEFESAMLIGLLKGPYFYHPIRKLKRLKKRTSIVFRKLQSLGAVSEGAKEWSDKEWDDWLETLKNRNETRAYFSLWESKKNLSTHFNSFEKYHFIYQARTKLIELKKKLKNKFKTDLAIKAHVKNLRTGNTFQYYSKFERSSEKAIKNELHQVGSTIKPIIYSLFFNYDYAPGDMVSTAPITLRLLSGEWGPRESHKNLPEEVTLVEALQKSYNRPVVRIADEIGMENLEENLKQLFPNLKTPLREYPSQLLGAIELSLEQLVLAYENQIRDACEREEDKDVFNILSDPNLTTISKRVNKDLASFSFFGKTGTSNNGLDNWFIFFDGIDIGVIWTGDERRKDGKKLPLYGSNSSFPIFNEFYRSRGKRFTDYALERSVLCTQENDGQLKRDEYIF